MIPGLAGMAEIPYSTFFLDNVAGAVVWGASFVLLGYVAGATWERAATDASRAGLALLLLILVGLIGARVVWNLRERGEPFPDRLARIRQVAWFRRRYPGASAWLARRVDTGSARGFLLSITVVAGAICGWVFAAITQDVLAHEKSVLLDPGISRSVIAYRTDWATSLMRASSWFGSNLVLVPVVLVIGGYFLAGRRRDWRPGLLLVCSLAGANALYRVVKPLVGRPRPPDPFHLVTAAGSAFPSGHATAFPSGHVTAAVAVWGMVAVLLGGGSRGRAVLAWLAAALIALLVGLSRIYLGVHWWTDVVGGYGLGGLWLCVVVSVMLIRRRPKRPSTLAAEEERVARRASETA